MRELARPEVGSTIVRLNKCLYFVPRVFRVLGCREFIPIGSCDNDLKSPHTHCKLTYKLIRRAGFGRPRSGYGITYAGPVPAPALNVNVCV